MAETPSITRNQPNISEQVKQRASQPIEDESPVLDYDGDITQVVSTGSTLLDLAISGGRVRGGGIPLGIIVEVFGPSGTGKTVLLCELAGDIQRKNGPIRFYDPEARINKSFASMFGVTLRDEDYETPDTVTALFKDIREWKPESAPLYGLFADSLAALSTDVEMEKDEGDKMGGRRAKEFSQEMRKTCRIIQKNNYLVVCSNQVRQNMNAGPYEPKYSTPGGEAVKFYSSLRLHFKKSSKIKATKKFNGKEIERVIGVETLVEVAKSSIWKPYGTAPLTIIFDYGIDDIRQSLAFLKTYGKSSIYSIPPTVKNNEEIPLNNSMEKSIAIVEARGYEEYVREATIDLWEQIELSFESNRKDKGR